MLCLVQEGLLFLKKKGRVKSWVPTWPSLEFPESVYSWRKREGERASRLLSLSSSE